MSTVTKKDNVVRRLGRGLTVSMDKYLPDAFIFALILSGVVFLLGVFIAKKTPYDMVNYWYGGFWGFLAFSMQMALIVITGHCLATTKLVGGWLDSIAVKASNPKKAVTIVVLVSFFAAWINWGFGLVIGALIAKKISSTQKGIDFPLMVAAAYTGAISGMFGLSLTAPLLVNTPGHFLEGSIGLIPVTDTIFSMQVLLINVVMLLLLLVVFRLMVPTKKEEIFELRINEAQENENVVEQKPNTIAEKLERSSIISYILGAFGLFIVVNHFIQNGLDLNINIVNFLFLVLGVILHKNPINYVKAVSESVKSVYGVILQFPFYAGIMGMMSSSGLVAIFANWIVSFTTPASYPFLTFVQVGIVNFFVPSAGGQWMIQGPILITAGEALGVAAKTSVIAYSFGDLSTNLIQPFWALPVLGIANLKIKDIWGYCFVGFIVFFVVCSIGLTIL
jgi:short-chain fatty acids transporter